MLDQMREDYNYIKESRDITQTNVDRHKGVSIPVDQSSIHA